jgi:hypothetical protein
MGEEGILFSGKEKVLDLYKINNPLYKPSACRRKCDKIGTTQIFDRI